MCWDNMILLFSVKNWILLLATIIYHAFPDTRVTQSCISCTGILHLEFRSFLHTFLFNRIDPQPVYTSRIIGAFVHHATGNIFSRAQYFRAQYAEYAASLSLSASLFFFLLSRMCQRSGMRPSQASCSYAFRSVWHFLSRLANPPTSRSSHTEISPSRTYISRKCLVIKTKTTWSVSSRRVRTSRGMMSPWSYLRNFSRPSIVAIFSRWDVYTRQSTTLRKFKTIQGSQLTS